VLDAVGGALGRKGFEPAKPLSATIPEGIAIDTCIRCSAHLSPT